MFPIFDVMSFTVIFISSTHLLWSNRIKLKGSEKLSEEMYEYEGAVNEEGEAKGVQRY